MGAVKRYKTKGDSVCVCCRYLVGRVTEEELARVGQLLAFRDGGLAEVPVLVFSCELCDSSHDRGG